MFTADDHAFVICAYGENPYIEQTVASLQAQTVPSKVLLSTSTPCDYLRGVCERSGIKMIVNPKGGGAAADWNYAYDHAGTPLVTIAHQDDLYEPAYLERVLAEANAYDPERLLLVFTDYYELRNGERVESNRLLRVKRILNAPFKSHFLNYRPSVKRRVLGFGNPICCPSVTYNRSVLGPSVFDTRYVNSCDYQTYVELASRRGHFAYLPEPLMGHRIYGGSATTKNIGENIRAKEDAQILSTLWPGPVARLVNRVYATSEKSNEL